MQQKFKVLVTNIDDSDFVIEELPGVTISPGQEIDILDSSLPSYYTTVRAALMALGVTIHGSTLSSSSLYSGLQQGKLAYYASPQQEE